MAQSQHVNDSRTASTEILQQQVVPPPIPAITPVPCLLAPLRRQTCRQCQRDGTPASTAHVPDAGSAAAVVVVVVVKVLLFAVDCQVFVLIQAARLDGCQKRISMFSFLGGLEGR